MAVGGEGLTKSFAGQRVLDGVDIALDTGEVHVLLGANGSGKSTLVKILTGVYQPDAGRIRIGGRVLSGIASPHEANALGIAVVHQEAPLIDSVYVWPLVRLTATEYVCTGGVDGLSMICLPSRDRYVEV